MDPGLFSMSMDNAADFIAAEIDRVSLLYPGETIRIAAACNGGVTVQNVLKKYPSVAAKVSHFVSFTSAHQGTQLAPLGEIGMGFLALP